MKGNNSFMYFIFSFSYFLYKKISDDSTPLTQKERFRKKHSKNLSFLRGISPVSHIATKENHMWMIEEKKKR